MKERQERPENLIFKNAMKLAEAVSRSDESLEDIKVDIENIKRYLECFPKYFISVINHVIEGGVARFLYEGEEYRAKKEKLDHDRRSCHIAATDAVSKLNRLAKFYGAYAVFWVPRALDPDNINDRNIAAAMSYNFCTLTFLDETERSSYHTSKGMDADLLKIADGSCHFRTKLETE